MKKIFLFILAIPACFVFRSANAQIDSTDGVHWTVLQCDFDTLCPVIDLHTEVPGNLWQVGIPSKTVFNAAHSPLKALVTDTINTYPVSNYSYFDLKLNVLSYMMNPTISFYNKWDMDSLTEGAWIDISYDKGLTWKNIVYDSSAWPWPPHPLNSAGLYGINDTIYGGNPAFTGRSNGWVLTEAQWFWFILTKGKITVPVDTVMLRFNFISDSIDTHKDGWMIDDLKIVNYEVGGIAKNDNELILNISPNPADNIIKIDVPESNIAELCIYNIDGKAIAIIKPGSGRQIEINVKSFSTGLYWIRIITDNGKIGHARFIKE